MSAVTAGTPGALRGGGEAGPGRVPVLTGRPEPRGHRRPADSPTRRAAAGWAVFLGLLGLGYRVLLVRWEVPPGTASEGAAGLAALRIAQGQELPIFLDSGRYVGALQAYLAAPFVRVLGTSWWSVRLPALICFAGFLVVAYLLLRRLYSPWFAAAMTGLFALGSDRVIRNEVVGGGALPAMLLATALLMLLTVRLAAGEVRRPAVGLLGWGVLAGVMIWTHWWVLPFVGAAGVMLLLGFQRGGLQSRPGLGVGGRLLTLAGLAVGLTPLIAYAVLGSPRNPLTLIVATAGDLGTAPLADRATGTLLTAVPISTGLCAPGECVGWQAWWGPAYLALLAAALMTTAVALADARGFQVARYAGRLVLIIGAVLTLGGFVATAGSALTPAVNARNLHYTLLALPAVLWPLWKTAGRLWGRRARTVFAAAAGLIGSAALAAVLALAVAATATMVLSGPAVAAGADDDRELIAALDSVNATRIYSDGDTCDRVTYATGERIICAVVDDRLQQRGDHFPTYGLVVRAAETPAYVLLSGGATDRAFAAFRARTLRVYDDLTAAGYTIYIEQR